MRTCTWWIVLVSAGLMAAATGCMHKGPVDYTPPRPTGIVFLESPPSSLAVNATATVAASFTSTSGVLGTTFDTPVSYAVTCGSSNACGTLGSNEEAGAVTYKAPAAVPSGGTVTITASGDGFSTSVTVNITPPIPIQVAFFAAPPASLEVSASFLLSASITNDTTTNPQVAWTVACGSSQCGSFSPTSTGDEEQTTYAAPSTIPAGGSVTITITSLTDTTKTASATIAISAPSTALVNGTYVFQVAGVPGIGASFVTGVLTASDGAITGGEQDVANYSGTESTSAYTEEQAITGGSYAATADGNLAFTINVDNGGTEALEGRVSANGKGFVNDLDGSAASGTLDLQTSTAAPSGGYAVSVWGGDPYYEAVWIGGIVNVDGPRSISGAGSILDVDDPTASAVGTLMLSQSTVSAPDSYGRVVLKLEPALGASFPAVYLAAYAIDETRMRLVETGDAEDDSNFQGVLGGTALAQGISTGEFTTASLAGQSFVFGGSGVDQTGPLDVAGILTAHADGTLAGVLNWNDLSESEAQKPLAFTGTYSVDFTGRVTLTQLTDGSTFNYSLHFYLAAGGEALFLSDDGNDVFDGQVFPATAGTAVSGNYGLNAAAWTQDLNIGELQASALVGTVTVTPETSGTGLSGYADTGPGGADFALTGDVAPGSGGVLTGTMAGFAPAARSQTNSFSLYPINAAQGLLMETDNGQLVLGVVGR